MAASTTVSRHGRSRRRLPEARLRPNSSLGWEWGASGRHGGVYFRISAFQDFSVSARVTMASHRSHSHAAAKSSGLVKAGERPADVVAFEDSLVSFFIDAADILGVPKSVAAIYGICFASPEPLSFSDINERLDISSGSISQGLRVLREVGALKIAQHEKLKSGKAETLKSETDLADDVATDEPVRDHPNGSDISDSQHVSLSAFQRAAARYEPDLKARKLVSSWLDQRLRQQLDAGRSRLDTILRTIPPEHANEESVVRGRIEHLQNWHQKAHALLPVIKAFLKLG